ncbi:MAG: L,D-transpeptidase [Fluviicola sp.]
MKRSISLLLILVAFIVSCGQKEGEPKTASSPKSNLPDWRKPKKLAYEIRNAGLWLQDSTVDSSLRSLVYLVNRADKRNFSKMDTVIVPVDLSGDIVYYFPFPLEIPYLKEIDKLVFFSYPTQSFAVYEKGILIHTGPTNMGRENAQTPTGLFYTNWKARKTISTVNDEWELLWNFNILNKGGVGWHQYELPGYPASHSCLRLTESDAKYLYKWVDQWVLADKTTVRVKGTPVIVFGSYDFKGPKPWLKLITDPHALDISADQIEQETRAFKDEILREQENRKNYLIQKRNAEQDSLI